MAMMAPKSSNSRYRPLAEINVTPLVDVMLVLLIIFMVTAPMLASGMKVNLPQAKQVQPLDPKAPIIVTVGKDSTLSLGSDAIERDKLISAIQDKLGTDTSLIIHLRGDKEAAYGDVVAVMDLLATNGLTHIAIVADSHSKSDTGTKTGVSVKPDVAATLNAGDTTDGSSTVPGGAPIAPDAATVSASSTAASSSEARLISTTAPAASTVPASSAAPASSGTPRP
jgi:biopolymer transport protein TolR